MNQVQVVELLNTLQGIAVHYDHSDESAPLPKLEVHVNQGSNFAADNKVYVQGWDFTLDLYTKYKEPATEKLVKDLLNNNGLAWLRSETFLSDENCYEIEFTFSVLGDETDPTPAPDPEPDPEPDPAPDGDADD